MGSIFRPPRLRNGGAPLLSNGRNMLYILVFAYLGHATVRRGALSFAVGYGMNYFMTINNLNYSAE